MKKWNKNSIQGMNKNTLQKRGIIYTRTATHTQTSENDSDIEVDPKTELCQALLILIREYEHKCISNRIKAGIQRKKISDLSSVK